MQQTTLPTSNTTGRTGDREPLFCRQVTRPHVDTVGQNNPQNCAIQHTMFSNDTKSPILPHRRWLHYLSQLADPMSW